MICVFRFSSHMHTGMFVLSSTDLHSGAQAEEKSTGKEKKKEI